MKSLNPEINGITGTKSNPINNNSTDRVYFKDGVVHVDPNPGHPFQEIYEQVYGFSWTADVLNNNNNNSLNPTMEGFAQQAENVEKGLSEMVMNRFSPDAVPVYKELVSKFRVCDRWFASIPTSMQPNQLYVHSTTSRGATSNDTKLLVEGYPQKTIFESLEEKGFSFGIYYQYPPSTLFYKSGFLVPIPLLF